MRYLTKAVDYKLGEPVRLVLFSDLHVGSAGFAKNHFKKFLSSAMDHPNAWALGIGDQLDCIVPSDTKRFEVSAIAPHYLSSEHPGEILDLQKEELISILAPYKTRILGLLMGNHCQNITKRYGTNIHRQICKELETENLGYSCLLLLKLRDNATRTRSYVIFAHHGYGGGTVSEGYSVTKFSRFIYSYDADLYVTAHDHQLYTKRLCRVGINQSGNMQDKTIILCNTGAFLKSLSDTDSPGYGEVKGYPPRVLGGLVIDLLVDSHKWIDVKVVE